MIGETATRSAENITALSMNVRKRFVRRLKQGRHLQRHGLPVDRRQTLWQVAHQDRHHCPQCPTMSNCEEGGEEVRLPDVVHWGNKVCVYRAMCVCGV